MVQYSPLSPVNPRERQIVFSDTERGDRCVSACSEGQGILTAVKRYQTIQAGRG